MGNKSIKQECLEIEAGVRGTDEYYTTLLFNTDTFSFENGDCDCPYNDYCKHMAAMGLKFIEQFHMFLSGRNVFTDTNDVAESFVAWLSGKQHSVQKIVPIPIISMPVKKQEPIKPFSERYDIILTASYGRIHPGITEKNSFHYYHQSYNTKETASRLLKKEGENLTPEERSMLVFLQNKDSWMENYDYGELFFLLKNSELSVYLGNKTEKNKAIFEETPEKIGVEIFTREENSSRYEKENETIFVFRLEQKYVGTAKKQEQKVLYLGTKYAVTVCRENIALHPISSLIHNIIKRILSRNQYSNHKKESEVVMTRETALTDTEVIKINDVLREVAGAFNLTTVLSSDIEISEHSKTRPMIAIDYNHKHNTLDMRALIDYGIEKIDVSESVRVSRRMGKIFFDRQSEPPHKTHIIHFLDGKISYAKIENGKEIEFFKKLYHSETYGFNKHVKCHREGEKQIANFAFGAFSEVQKLGFPIEFTQDELKTSFGNFKADFSVQMDAEIDWLAFDVACYCGEDTILPEDLRDYVHNNREFLKMADGTIKKIKNRDELERFVAMLESFNERENGRFEGRAYNAPELDNVFTSSKYYNAKLSDGFQKFMKEAKSGLPVKKVRIPSAPDKILRDYQKEGVHWFHFLRKYRFAGILADDMGLGKTLQALTLFHMNKNVGVPSLVVCPKTLISVWYDEAKKFFPEMRVLVLDGLPKERAEKINRIGDFDFAVTSYATLQRDEEVYKKRKVPFHYLLLDEAQNIKNHTTKNAQAVKKVDAEYRLALTGTPLENTVAEIWSLFEFLMPGFLGNHASFTRGFLKPIMKENSAEALAHLRQKVECFMLRRTKREVLKELPDKIEQVRSCKMTDAQNVLYQEILARVKKDIFDSVKTKGYEKSHIHILAGLTKLRQVCNHPVLLLKDKNYQKYESAKLELFNELVGEIAAAGRKVLVFSQFTSMLDILAKELKNRKIEYSYLSGKTNKRKDVVASFNEDTSKTVFLISLKAGGTGLTLTSADNVIIFDPWWNPSVENQAIDRTHRIGQKNTVNVYKLVTEGTIEEKIIELQKRKKFLFDALVGESGDLFKKLTWEDIQELF